MITRLCSPAGDRIYDGEIGRFVESSVIPCHRCGICCRIWQPPVGPADVQRLADYLGISAPDFIERYTTPYPFDESRLLRQENGGCVFLQSDDSGRSSCAVYPARPDACRAWLASLDRPECVEGLRRHGDAALLPIAAVYPDAADRWRFAGVVRSAGVDEAHDG